MPERDPLFVAPKLTGELLWNLDNTLAQILAQSIRDFRTLQHGYPALFDDQKEWLAVLDEMADGFQAYADADSRGENADYDKLNRSLDLLRKWFPHLWD